MSRCYRIRTSLCRAAGKLGLALALAITLAGPLAAAYPDRPLRLVVPYPPGGPSEILGRLVAQMLTERLGQPVIVENKPGAGGTIGTAGVAKSAADGYTLLFANLGPIAVAPAVYSALPYDPINDFSPIANLVVSPFFLVVGSGSPFKTLSELVASDRAKPAALNFGSAGVGSLSHAIGELFNQMAGTRFVHVPYKGTAPAVVGLIGGEHSFFFSTPIEALAHIKGGRMRALAISSPERSPLAPDLPTVAESGVSGFDAQIWYGLMASPGTPKAIVDRIHADSAKGMVSAALKARLLQLGVVPSVSTPDEFRALIAADVAKWSKLVKAAGIKAD